MDAVHRVVGFAIVGALALLPLWGLATLVLRRGPGRAFWWLVTAVQVGILAQVVAGVVLLAMGRERSPLHYLYGGLFPAIVFGVAHWLARDAYRERPWIPFAAGGFIAFGLTLRALTTGLT
ncbi:MAG TPA: hypothetical protein VGB51_09180 [Actinomycetota bacterium]